MRGVYMNNNRLKVKFLVRNHYYKICDNHILYLDIIVATILLSIAIIDPVIEKTIFI